MKRMILFFILSLLFASPSPAQERGDKKQTGTNKIIVVLGSSVASGCVTSYEARYDMKNGYAYRLQRLLESQGYSVINRSVPGDATADLLNRLNKDLASLEADFAIIGLSLGNSAMPATRIRSSIMISQRR